MFQKYRYIILAISLMIFPTILSAQYSYDDQTIKEKPFSESKWKKLKKNIDYTKNVKSKDAKKEDAESKEGRRGDGEKPSSNWSPNSAMFQGSQTLKIIFFTIAILALMFVLWRIVQAQMKLKNPKIRKKIENLEEAVENIQETDLERFLREALEANNFKLAIRIYYLMIIKTLAEQNLIKWKKDKTNNAYVREMRKTEYYDGFKNITRKFERAWFGEKGVSEQDFQRLQPEFSSFVSVIK